MTKLLESISNVLPSGAARYTASAAITPPAPVRFSISIVGPCARPICSPNTRGQNVRAAARCKRNDDLDCSRRLRPSRTTTDESCFRYRHRFDPTERHWGYDGPVKASAGRATHEENQARSSGITVSSFFRTPMAGSSARSPSTSTRCASLLASYGAKRHRRRTPSISICSMITSN
jgi:hypothetical protein